MCEHIDSAGWLGLEVDCLCVCLLCRQQAYSPQAYQQTIPSAVLLLQLVASNGVNSHAGSPETMVYRWIDVDMCNAHIDETDCVKLGRLWLMRSDPTKSVNTQLLPCSM